MTNPTSKIKRTIKFKTSFSIYFFILKNSFKSISESYLLKVITEHLKRNFINNNFNLSSWLLFFSLINFFDIPISKIGPWRRRSRIKNGEDDRGWLETVEVNRSVSLKIGLRGSLTRLLESGKSLLNLIQVCGAEKMSYWRSTFYLMVRNTWWPIGALWLACRLDW